MRNKLILAALVVLSTGCYGPAYLQNHRSPDNWSRVPKGFKCDAYSNNYNHEFNSDSCTVR